MKIQASLVRGMRHTPCRRQSACVTHTYIHTYIHTYVHTFYIDVHIQRSNFCLYVICSRVGFCLLCREQGPVMPEQLGPALRMQWTPVLDREPSDTLPSQQYVPHVQDACICIRMDVITDQLIFVHIYIYVCIEFRLYLYPYV